MNLLQSATSGRSHSVRCSIVVPLAVCFGAFFARRIRRSENKRVSERAANSMHCLWQIVDHRTARKWMPMLAFISSVIECADVCVRLRFMNVDASICVRVCIWHSLSYYEPHRIYVSTSNSCLIYSFSHTTSRTTSHHIHNFTNLFTLCRFLAVTFRMLACSLAYTPHTIWMSSDSCTVTVFALLSLSIYLFWLLFRVHWRYNIFTVWYMNVCMLVMCVAVNQSVNLNYATLANRSSNFN